MKKTKTVVTAAKSVRVVQKLWPHFFCRVSKM